METKSFMFNTSMGNFSVEVSDSSTTFEKPDMIVEFKEGDSAHDHDIILLYPDTLNVQLGSLGQSIIRTLGCVPSKAYLKIIEASTKS